MYNTFAKIITASAGTGKTYRLSLEYISLVLKYHHVPDWSAANILVLTFTKKATSEIRSRILNQLSILAKKPEGISEYGNLVAGLRSLSPAPKDAPQGSLSTEEELILLSVYLRLEADASLLQVMTIDSYISSIFRNLVSPLRSIDSYEIDLKAVEKRLPFLLEILMKPDFRSRIDSLLKRRISPSLDDYSKFFASLIEQRWQYYLITGSYGANHEGTHFQRFADVNSWESLASSELDTALKSIKSILNIVHNRAKEKKNEELTKYFKKGFFDSFERPPESFEELPGLVEQACEDSRSCRKLHKAITNEVFWKLTAFGKGTEDRQAQLNQEYQKAVLHLANHLVYRLQFHEQAEILAVWGSILAEYDKLIYRYKNFNYDDVSWFTFEALFSTDPPYLEETDPEGATEFYEFLSHRSRFLLIDEFQDTSLLQYNILKPIIFEVISGMGSKDMGGLIVVGDEKQSIFSWRGGERDLLLNMASILENKTQLITDSLSSSWRSSPMLMNFVNAVFGDACLQSSLKDMGLTWDYNPVSSEKPELDAISLLQLKIESYQTTGKNITRSLNDVYINFVKDMVIPFYNENTIKKEKQDKNENENENENKPETIAILCRKSNELNIIQGILDDEGLGSIYQPSAGLPEHNLVRPLLHWLRFVAYRDPLEFLAFLRSDYLRIDPATLKAVVDSFEKLNADNPIPALEGIAPADSFYQLALYDRERKLTDICNDMVQLCIDNDSLGTRDMLNLKAFLDVVSNYESEHRGSAYQIPDFLNYLEDNSGQDFLRQRSIENSSSLELQTIHKAKGLEYDRVFLFYNISSSYHDRDIKLKTYAEYEDKGFAGLKDFVLCLHYEDVLKNSEYAHLIQNETAKDLLEELNTLYVAFTRAKTKLHIMFTYLGSQSWEEYLGKDRKSDKDFPVLLCAACNNYMMQAEAEFIYESRVLGTHTSIEKPASEEVQQSSDDSPSLLPIGSYEPVLISTQEEHQIMASKQEWLQRRSSLYGNIAHFYLSFIYRNSTDERDFAKSATLKNYGGILPATEILYFLAGVDARLQQLPELFDEHWDKIYTEFPLFEDGKELRMDRLMLDTKNKKAMIIDYKTGNVHDPEQLDRYAIILQKQNAVLKGAYQIATAFVEI